MTTSEQPARPWERPWVLDVVVVVALQALGAATLASNGTTDQWWVWLLDQALILPLLARRRYPLPVFGVAAAVALAQWAVGVRLVADLGLLVALYTVAERCPRRQAVAAAGVLEIGVVLASVRFVPAGDGVAGSLVFLTGLVTAAFFLGTTVRTRRDYLDSLEDRAMRLERDRDQQAQLAVTAERTRIAREMHDVVAHSLSVMITLADGAVATGATHPVEAQGAMRQVAATGRQALTEMRRLLGVLRDPVPAERAPQPTLDRVDALLDDFRSTGLRVRLVVTGAPGPVPTTAEATVYRIIQESLTNVLKHAIEPSQATVTLAWGDGELVVQVQDDGEKQLAPVPAGTKGGHGLRGMRERVALFDGDLSAGPTRPRGWTVQARLRTRGRDA